MNKEPMTLNKQALRELTEAANIASFGKWEAYKPHKGARGYEVKVGGKAIAQHCLKVDAAFIAAANPATVLALLDELESETSYREGAFVACNRWHDKFRESEAKLEAAEKRIAELEAHILSISEPRARIEATGITIKGINDEA